MDINVLRECGKTISFKNGEVICREGEKGQSLLSALCNDSEDQCERF